MLDKLKELLRINGKLSGLIIDEAADCPSSSMFRSRFGSLLKSYREVGYTPSRDYRYLKINRALRRTHANLVEQTIAEIERLGERYPAFRKTIYSILIRSFLFL